MNITVPTLAKERENPTFDIHELNLYLDGGDEEHQSKQRIMLEFERDPTMKVSDIHDLDFNQIRAITMQKVRRIASYLSRESVEKFRKRMEILAILDPGTWTRVGVHFGLFFGALRGGANAQQLSFWIQKGALSLNGVIGCFAMTELGHGSNVSGLETTATFDEASDEFVIHTPTLTATKWWIGGAAQSATHSVVYAQMIVKGKRYGVKNFVVQLRNPKDFSLLPGIVIGDIGAKMGRHGVDNGWIQFTHVRIPRSHMLMKHTQVNRHGIVTEPPLQQLAYGALITGRVSMVLDSGNMAKKALVIAIRYAAIRRQFGSKKGELETKILDYPIHQYRLMPLLAQAYAMHFTGVEMTSIYDSLMQSLESLGPNDKNMGDVLDSLKEVHGTSAGLKAFCTWNCLNIIDQCRQSCGGHGYSAYTGLASMYSDFAVQCTWEGDNTILTLQAGRYLVGSLREAKNGKRQTGGVAYLNDLNTLLKAKCNATQPFEVTDLNLIGQAFNVISGNVIKKAEQDFEDGLKKGLSEDEAYEECSQARLYAAKMHSFGYLFHRFKDAVTKCPQSLKPVLSLLCQLYGLYNILENSGAFLQYQFFKSIHIDWIHSQVSELCKKIRHQAIPLTDAFGYSDFILNSPLGKYHGDIYESYFSMVNAAHPPAQVPSYFAKDIYPLLNPSRDTEQEELELDEED